MIDTAPYRSLVAPRPVWRGVVLALVALLLAAQPVGAQPVAAQPAGQDSTGASVADTNGAENTELASPEAAMFRFLEAMSRYRNSQDADDLDEALETIDLRGVPAEGRRQIAGLLLRVLDRVSLVEPWHFSTYGPDGEASGRYIYFPQRRVRDHAEVAKIAPDSLIEFERGDDGGWRFSQRTVSGLNAFERRIGDLPRRVAGEDLDLTLDMVLRSRMPESLRAGEVLGIEYWQWIGLFVVIFLGFLVDLTVRALLRGAWTRVERRRGQTPDKELLKKAVRPFGLVAGAAVWYALVTPLGLPPVALKILLIAVRVVLMLALVWSGYRLVDLMGDLIHRQAEKTRTKLDDLLVPLARKTAKVFITVFGVIYIAESFDVQILPLLTGLGIGGLAFAFAAKDTIENFFGSVAVILDQPFEVGDWVVIGEVEGTVETLGLRSTRIRTFYNSQVTVPNASLVRATVDNYGRRRYRRFTTKVGLTYDTPPEKIEAFCEGVREIVRQHPYTRKDYFHVYLNGFGASSLDVLVYIFFECPDWSVELREKQRFILDTIRVADRLGVSFAFPTQTIELKALDPNAPEPEPRPVPDRRADSRAVVTGRDTARELLAHAAWHEIKPGPVSFVGSTGEEARGSADDAGE